MLKSWLRYCLQKYGVQKAFDGSRHSHPLSGIHRNFQRLGKRYLTAMLLTSLLLPLSGLMALADDFNPPDRGLPGRRRGGGTRNPLSQCLQSKDQGLTALLPENDLGLTIADYPQIFWFVPEHQAPFVEVSLYDTNVDFQDQNLLFLSQFATTGEAGINQFKIPEAISFAPLEEGKTYHWYISLICDPNDRAQDIVASGWLERAPVSATLAAALDTLEGIDRYRVLAREGLWFDAVDTLATLRCTQPENASLIQSLWQTLLADSQVNLDEFTDSPWIKPCGRETP